MPQPIKKIIDINKYLSKEFISIKNKLLDDSSVNEITPEFFVYYCLNHSNTILYTCVNNLVGELSLDKLIDKINDLINISKKDTVSSKSNVKFSKDFDNYLIKSLDELNNTKSKYINSSHFLLSVLKDENSQITKIFNKFGMINYSIALNLSEKLHDAMNFIYYNDDLLAENEIKKNKQNNSIKKYEIPYCINVNDFVKNQLVDELIGCENEIEYILTVLLRRNTNNVILVGENGVGKTQIVYGLSKRIVNGEVPKLFKSKTIFKFNPSEVIAGATLRGMMEERLLSMVNALKLNKNSILFIDDIHNVFNKKQGSDDFDCGGIISELLSNGDVQVIATTTYKGYKTLCDFHCDLSKKMQKIQINPVDNKTCISILNGIKDKYEKFHNVIYSDDIICECVDLSNRYITDKKLPSSAIDIMDEVGSYKKIENDSLKNKQLEITSDDLYKTISKHTNIPIGKIKTSDKLLLKNINNTLKNIIIGQDEAIDIVSNAIKRNKVGLSNNNKPIFSCMFIGNTGVGKTFLAKMLAKEIYGDEKFLVRFDMSEYSDKTSVNKLIGASAGYVGYNDGGLLTEAVKNNKYCILLIDEIEKANDEIYNLFLQVLDEGFLTDNTGQKVDFKNTMIILTSNIGSKKTLQASNIDKKSIFEKELKEKFPPEFINRLDEIVYFNSLNKENLKDIIKLELKKLNIRLKNINMSLSFNDDVVNKLLKLVEIDKDYGARPILRIIQKEIENKITDLIINNDYDNHNFIVDINNDEIVIN